LSPPPGPKKPFSQLRREPKPMVLRFHQNPMQLKSGINAWLGSMAARGEE
jgi:hypothetical protein